MIDHGRPDALGRPWCLMKVGTVPRPATNIPTIVRNRGIVRFDALWRRWNQESPGEGPSLLDNETGMHSCLVPKPRVAGSHRRQEEASPWSREYRHPNGQAINRGGSPGGEVAEAVGRGCYEAGATPGADQRNAPSASPVPSRRSGDPRKCPVRAGPCDASRPLPAPGSDALPPPDGRGSRPRSCCRIHA